MFVRSSEDLEEAQCPLIDVYSADAQPTLLIDTSNTKVTRGVHLNFANDAFTEQYSVLLGFIISGQVLEPSFIEWLKSPEPSREPYILGDLSWSFFILKQRWKVVNVAASATGGYLNAATMSYDRSRTGTCSNSAESVPLSTSTTDSSGSEPKTISGLTVAFSNGLVSLGSASTALEGLHRSVDLVDVGFFEYDVNGTLIFANKSWYAQSDHPLTPQGHTEQRFLDLCHPDDQETVSQAWNGLLQGKPITFEMRWKHVATPSAILLGAQWVLAACVPLYDEHGRLTSISGCTTDINNQKLSQQIAISRAEALERARTFEERFIRFAAVAPIVIFNFDASKKMTYCNDRWFEVTATQKKAFKDIDISEGFFEEDAARLFALVTEATKNQEVNSLEMRTKKAWRASDGRMAQSWVSATIFAEFTNGGTFQGCTGTLTDISDFKYAETLQRIRLEEALEAKRQQEDFIDMTSHEMRNPLSAMVQCADSALAAVREISSFLNSTTAESLQQPTRTKLLEEVEIGRDGLQTILSCCAHQKSIIDDVLTLSKLDSNLLAITPVKVQPHKVMQEVAKMFEMDAQKADLTFSTHIDDSITRLDVQWLMLDPSRVKQILINLVSNAVKFTRTEASRQIALTMGASVETPTSNESFRYAPASQSVGDGFLVGDDWGTGEVVHLIFSVRDTGRGLSRKEQEKLFNRFVQASPKTHVEYGGSGLGLFTARRLTELQGGEIGLASREKRGSTFSFYIRTRRATAPTPLSSSANTSTPALPVRSLISDSKTSPFPNVKATDTAVRPQSVFNDLHANVLIVEDNIVNQKVLSTQLKRLGCTVYVAGHGLEALDFLKTTRLWREAPDTDGPSAKPTVDVILMDIEMPVMRGLDCTRAIRELERKGSIGIGRVPETQNSNDRRCCTRLPIISISANARAEQSDEQKEAGVDDVLTKPFRIRQLMEKIWKLLYGGTPISPH